MGTCWVGSWGGGGAKAIRMFYSFYIIFHTQTWDSGRFYVYKGHDSLDSAVISLCQWVNI